MKKKLLVVLSLSTLLVVTSCGGEKAFKKDFAGNMEVMKTDCSKVTVLEKVNFDRLNTVAQGNGVFLTTKDDGTKEVYSVAAKKVIATLAKEENITLITKSSMSYINVTKSITDDDGTKTNTFKLYDILGNLVHEEKENYNNSSLKISLKEGYDSIEENISYTKKSGETVVAVYSLKKDGTRNSKISNLNSLFDYFSDDEETNMMNNVCGLNGYLVMPSTSSSSKSIYMSIYKESSKELVNTIHIDMTYQNPLFLCSGKFYYYTNKMLPQDAKEYDYLAKTTSSSYSDAFVKYSYNLYYIDLLSGKEKEVKTDFVIKEVEMEAAMLLSGINKKAKYFPATIQKIDENKLLKDEENVVLDDKQNIVFTSNLFDISSLSKLSDERYLANTSTSSSSNKVLLDKNFNVLCELQKPVVVDVENKLIYCTLIGNKIGAIDYDLNIKTKFEYDSIVSNGIIDGRIVLEKDSKTHILKEGIIEKILADGEKYIANTKTIESKNTEANTYTYTTLDGKELFTIDNGLTVTSKAFTVFDKVFAYLSYEDTEGKINVYPFEIVNG